MQHPGHAGDADINAVHVQHHTTSYCTTLQHTPAAHCCTLHHIAAHCSTLLKHSETHCSTQQHPTAPHCNTPCTQESETSMECKRVSSCGDSERAGSLQRTNDKWRREVRVSRSSRHVCAVHLPPLLCACVCVYVYIYIYIYKYIYIYMYIYVCIYI